MREQIFKQIQQEKIAESRSYSSTIIFTSFVRGIYKCFDKLCI